LSQDFHFRLTHTNQQNYPNFLALLNFIAGQSEIEKAGQFFMEYNCCSSRPRPHLLKGQIHSSIYKLAGRRAAAIMGLLATAKANGHCPHAWLTDVLTRLPTTLDKHIGELLPHR
jgi:IS66 C-terminal element